MSVKIREAKSTEEKERYKHLNAEFQRIARGDKKAFFSNHCKEIEGNNRMGDQRSLQENQSYQGNISCKDGTKKDKNSIDLTEAKDIQKTCKEYTEELYKKDLQDPDNHDGVITQLEPDILK